MKKVKAYFYKPNCRPRIMVNPSHESLVALRKEGIVLINPNTASVKDLPLEHTRPDVENNMLRPVPIQYRQELGSLPNPMEIAKRETDESLKHAMKLIKTYRIKESDYKAKIEAQLQKNQEKVDANMAAMYRMSLKYREKAERDLNELQIDIEKSHKKTNKILITYVIMSNLLYILVYNSNIIMNFIKDL